MGKKLTDYYQKADSKEELRRLQIIASRGGMTAQQKAEAMEQELRFQAPPVDEVQVRYGDNVFQIAEDVYGDQRMAGAIISANDGVTNIQPGLKLKMPYKQADPYFSNYRAEQLGMATSDGPAELENRGEWRMSGSQVVSGSSVASSTQPVSVERSAPLEELRGPEAVKYGYGQGLGLKAISDQGPQVAYDPRGYWYEVGRKPSTTTENAGGRGYRGGKVQTRYNVQGVQGLQEASRYYESLGDTNAIMLTDILGTTPRPDNPLTHPMWKAILNRNSPSSYAPTRAEIDEMLTSEEKAEFWTAVHGITTRDADEQVNQIIAMYEDGVVTDADIEYLAELGVVSDEDVTGSAPQFGSGGFWDSYRTTSRVRRSGGRGYSYGRGYSSRGSSSYSGYGGQYRPVYRSTGLVNWRIS